MTIVRRMRLWQRIVLFGLLPLVVVCIAVGGLIVTRTFDALRADGERMLVEKTGSVADQIEAENRQVVTIPHVMANAEEMGLFGQRSDSLAYARSILAEFPDILAAYIAYEPDADGNDAASLMAGLPAAALSPEGRFIPYYVRRNADDPTDVTLENLVDMETSFYYRGVKNRYLMAPEMEGIEIPGGVSRYWQPVTPSEATRARPMVTEPYDYAGLFMVEQTYPIVKDGTFVGIAGVDRSLDAMLARLSADRPYPDAEIFLISGRGRVIASTVNDAFRLQTIESVPGWSALLSQVYQSSASRLDASGAQLTTDPETGAPLYYSAHKIPSGDWTLLIAAPEATILAQATDVMWITIGGLLVIVLGILLLVFGAVRYVSLRLRTAASAADRVAGNDLTVHIDDVSEIGRAHV